MPKSSRKIVSEGMFLDSELLSCLEQLFFSSRIEFELRHKKSMATLSQKAVHSVLYLLVFTPLLPSSVCAGVIFLLASVNRFYILTLSSAFVL